MLNANPVSQKCMAGEGLYSHVFSTKKQQPQNTTSKQWFYAFFVVGVIFCSCSSESCVPDRKPAGSWFYYSPSIQLCTVSMSLTLIPVLRTCSIQEYQYVCAGCSFFRLVQKYLHKLQHTPGSETRCYMEY